MISRTDIEQLLVQDLDALTDDNTGAFIQSAIRQLIGDHPSVNFPTRKLRIHQQGVPGSNDTLVTVFWNGNTFSDPPLIRERPFLESLQAALRDRLQDPDLTEAPALTLIERVEARLLELEAKLEKLEQRMNIVEHRTHPVGY